MLTHRLFQMTHKDITSANKTCIHGRPLEQVSSRGQALEWAFFVQEKIVLRDASRNMVT